MHGGGQPVGLRRRLRQASSTVPDSGLTGPIEIPDPKPADEPKDLRARLYRLRTSAAGTVRGLPKVIRLTWQASPAMTILIALSTLVSGLTPTVTAYVAKLLLDAVVAAVQGHGTTGRIVQITAFQLGVFTFTAVSTALTNVAQQLLQERMTLAIRHQVMAHAAKLDLAFFEGSESYDLLRQASQEAPARPVSMMTSALGLVRTGITFASMVALLIAVSPLLAVVALLAPIPAFISQSKYGSRAFMLALYVSPIRRRMDYLSSLVTTDTYAKETKLFGLGRYLTDRFLRLGQTYYARERKLTTTRNLVGTAWSFLSTAAGSGIALYIAMEAVRGRLTIGDLALYTSAATAVQSAVQGLFTGFSGMYENNLYLDTLYQFLGTQPQIAAPARPRPLPEKVRGHVEFEEVSFTYPGSGEAALDSVSFEIRPGETVAVVGRNGAGKSTLIKLLCRLYDPTGGRILLDGVDIREFDPDELRTQISAMFQDYVTYQGTAAENIGLGELSGLADRARIVDSAQRAGAAERIERLPKGYDSPLGRWFDQGVSLSGGEWQKVALARAFMRDAPILILDEPTSALDAQAEHDLFARLRALAAGRTTLYISHRFSTVRQAEKIMLLDHGKLAEHGTHEELMRLGGDYADLFTLQAAAYLDDPVG
ncbi:ABC transporter ATP-binding protein/permease [Amycolatopsis acidiphila]|uniref:ABC transporter ATP-binding protein n=1 Tax=Amycolatopsis acidiphila TaxID=715473 RepID=A0A558AFY6_9PSEU|nr:ABC transporter ATP-binding protein [Amycolatopsis acidiphila]TVT23177.1 ABC transporter ATP-binding protein [Amycolatopsis acidiphila]UIJ64160.1 ABC transporter ATP-binding protein/permease [Amycolatopsis acidiphila]GHG60785.1 multidrug ABC transporter permease [Amycolatopsis acidiphila]